MERWPLARGAVPVTRLGRAMGGGLFERLRVPLRMAPDARTFSSQRSREQHRGRGDQRCSRPAPSRTRNTSSACQRCAHTATSTAGPALIAATMRGTTTETAVIATTATTAMTSTGARGRRRTDTAHSYAARATAGSAGGIPRLASLKTRRRTVAGSARHSAVPAVSSVSVIFGPPLAATLEDARRQSPVRAPRARQRYRCLPRRCAPPRCSPVRRAMIARLPCRP